MNEQVLETETGQAGDENGQVIETETGPIPPPYSWQASKRGLHACRDEELPEGWQRHLWDTHKRYYFTHRSHPDVRFWRDPRWRPGWSQEKDSRTGRVFYMDHNNRATTWDLPAASLGQGEIEAAAADGVSATCQKIWIQDADRFYLVNHASGEERWLAKQDHQDSRQHPADPPPGWQRRLASSGRPFFVSYNTLRSSWRDPRETMDLPPTGRVAAVAARQGRLAPELHAGARLRPRVGQPPGQGRPPADRDGASRHDCATPMGYRGQGPLARTPSAPLAIIFVCLGHACLWTCPHLHRGGPILARRALHPVCIPPYQPAPK